MSEWCEEACTVHRHEIRKSRKEHRCSACRSIIRTGDFYASVFTVYDGSATIYKRCGACERTWQHLYELCREADPYGELYPMEDLSCGKSYEDEWGDLPDEIAALPLLSADERGQLLRPAGAPK